jgi:glycosyltransferase involved in cell wall biosynthesis
MKISLVVPAYNEEKRIKNMLLSYLSYFEQHYKDYEIIIVCDGSDLTAEVARKTVKGNKRVKILEFNKKLGKGGGIIEGFKKAEGNIIGYVDADESISPYDFNNLIKELKYYDCAIPSRRIEGTKILVSQPLARRVASKGFNILVRLLFNLHIKDTQCGAKVLRKKVIKKLIPILYHRGMVSDLELLWKLKMNNYSIKECPITWKHQEGSKFSLKMMIPNVFISTIKIRLGLER